MIKVAQFMQNIGMDAERVDLTEGIAKFCAAMREGLSGSSEGMPMLPTYLSSDGKLKKGKKAIVIDAGGTNFRTALVGFEGKTPVVEYMDVHPMPGAEDKATWEEFISHVADKVMPLLDSARDIGFCFSYPVEITPERDGKVLGLTKQVEIDGAVGSYLAESLRRELESCGEQVESIVVLNDTPATLLAGRVLAKGAFDGYVGLVAGTGCNTCCELKCTDIPKLETSVGKMLVNLESGSFEGFPRGKADLALDEALPDTGEYIAEKMISGRYLGDVCMHTLKLAAAEGLFSERATEIIEKMTEVTTPTIDKWGSGRFPKGFNSEDRVNLVYIISEIFERSARCIATMLCGILEMTGAGKSRPACIAVDGSLFSASKLLRPELERFMDVYAGEIMGRRYEFVNAENMSLIGAAAAVLLEQ